MLYIVQPGDTIWKIAQKFGVTVADIVAANNIADPSRIDIGQQLTIPVPAQQPTLSRGSQGPAVRVLQESLTTLGYNPGPVDGIFGPLTEAAVKAFQTDRKITVDGIVGPQTWGEIAKALAEKQKPPAPPTPPSPPVPGIPGEPANLPAPETVEPTEEIPYNLLVTLVPMGTAPREAYGDAGINSTTGAIAVTAFTMPLPSTFGAYTKYFAYLEAPNRRVIGEMALLEGAKEDYYVESTITAPIRETRVTVRPGGNGGTPPGPVVLVGRMV